MVESLNKFLTVKEANPYAAPLFDVAVKHYRKEITSYLKSIGATKIKHTKGRFYIGTIFYRRDIKYQITIGDYLLHKETEPYALIMRYGEDREGTKQLKLPLSDPGKFTQKIDSLTA